MSWTRRWHRAGSATLLIAAGAHLAAHVRAYVATPAADDPRAAVIAALQGYVLYEPLAVTLWTALGFFSLGFGALLVLLGTTHWILARETPPRVLRRHALRNALFGTVATLAAVALHPLPVGVVILAAPTLLFLLAAVPRPHDV